LIDANHPQLSLFGGQPSTPPMRRTSPRANKRVQRAATQAALPLVSKRFLPVTGTPGTRADCPDTSKQHCPYLRCRWHLSRLDASDRAGRPGLSSVPRDARGWTLPVEGDMGEKRAGTTAVPRWLELERRCTVWVERGDDGKVVALNAVREGEWDQFAAALHANDVVEARNENGEVVAMVRIGNENIALDRDVRDFVLVLTRVRGVESCALDAVKRYGKMGNQAIGDCIGRHRTLVAREVKGALAKAIETGEDMGIERHELMGALMRMGENR